MKMRIALAAMVAVLIVLPLALWGLTLPLPVRAHPLRLRSPTHWRLRAVSSAPYCRAAMRLGWLARNPA